MEEKSVTATEINDDNMNVLSSAEIIPLVILNEPFRSSSYAVILVQKGSFVFQNNFVKNTLSAKDAYLIAPDTLCELYEMSADVEFISLGFRKEFLKENGVFLNGLAISQLFSPDEVSKVSLAQEEFDELQLVLTRLKQKINSAGNYHKEIVNNAFLSVLYEVLIIYSRRRVFVSAKLNRQEELTVEFLSSLAENFRTEKQVQYYAKALCVTPRYLSQVVKKVTGKTAGNLIDEMVIKEAKVLLASQSMNVSEVADALQFSDQSFFGKFFKRNTGSAPSIYRNTMMGLPNPLF